MDSLLVIWIVIGFVALFIDIFTSTFIFVWFTVGSIAACIANITGYNVTIQILTFVLVSAVFMAVGYPLAKKTIKSTVKKIPTMEESYIGRVLTAESDFSDKTTVKVDGIYWTLKNSGEAIKKGDKIEITGIEGNKLVVKKI
ncbi:NfeD family protein [Clostridium oryzae]|uniref:NfeD-like C-terminal domain-containing protein n=1 Tax=Clostridium oryzae TaxID=1450648 RepID=A0A1V4IC48_9CLOT|nr:NfeD family protein [Clostridium oryzae]OPJ57526.1 hypothetical protein CLORY_40550 [Clostridium oryzae]